jgi:hypothetical protein
MNDSEILAKATIAAALIASHAVDHPSIPKGGQGAPDCAAAKLGDLTYFV